MTKDEDGSSGSGIEPTKVDLGDDLIEKTAIIPGHAAPSEDVALSERVPPESPAEQIRNARILLGEGFPEEAKKVLRLLLLPDSANVSPVSLGEKEEARQLLEQIHESELKQMFGSAEPSVRRSFTSNYDESILNVDSEEIIRILDRDIGLGTPPNRLEFFSDERMLAKFADQVDREMGDSPSDRTDLAIGFMEMGLYSVAIRLLQMLLVTQSEDLRLNASALVGYAHLMNDEPYRTIAVLQPILNDSEIDRSRKTECYYLMGRAEQLTGDPAGALSWYFQAQANETDYRDVAQRIVRCKDALSGK